MLSAQTLGMIGGFNVLGSLFFGWAGQRWNKLALLGGIYIFRSLALAWYFTLPATPASTLLFGAIMGFLWMGVGPLVAGAVAEMFGLRWQAMIQGLAFMSHQIGSFLGAYGGGLIYDTLGSYTMAWRIGVALGLARPGRVRTDPAGATADAQDRLTSGARGFDRCQAKGQSSTSAYFLIRRVLNNVQRIPDARRFLIKSKIISISYLICTGGMNLD
jgi:hypothetical protein